MSFSDDRNYFRGNPDLNPSYENSLELAYNISKKKFSLNPTLYWKKSIDEVNRYQYMDETGAINSIPFNIGSDSQFGLDLNGIYDPFKWWKLMLSFDLYGYKNEGSFNLYPGNPNTYMDFSGEGYSHRMRLNSTFRPTKTLNVQLQGFYRNGEKTAMINRKPMYGMDLGVTQTIWKGDGTISLSVRNLFNSTKFRMETNSAQYFRESEMKWGKRQISLSFAYRFKQGERIVNKKKRNSNNQEYQNGQMDEGEEVNVL